MIWEYALNEANFFAHRQSLESLIHHLEWLLHLCARRNLRFLALEMYNRSEAETFLATRYRRALARLFRTYDIEVIDVDKLRRTHFGRMSLDEIYSAEPHYSTQSDLLDLLVDKIVETLPQARVPGRNARAVHAFEGKDLALVSPSGGGARQFENRLMSYPVHAPESGLDCHGSGRLLACFLIASPRPGAVLFDCGQRQSPAYSTQIAPKGNGPKFQLKHLILWSEASRCLQSEGPVAIRAVRQGGGLVVQHTFSRNGVAAAGSDGSGIIALLMETRQ